MFDRSLRSLVRMNIRTEAKPIEQVPSFARDDLTIRTFLIPLVAASEKGGAQTEQFLLGVERRWRREYF